MNGYPNVLQNLTKIDTTNRDCSMNCLLKIMNEKYFWIQMLKINEDYSHCVMFIVLGCSRLIKIFSYDMVQIFSLFMRLNKEHNVCFYLNIYHHGVVYVVLIMGIINIF